MRYSFLYTKFQLFQIAILIFFPILLSIVYFIPQVLRVFASDYYLVDNSYETYNCYITRFDSLVYD